MMTAVLLLEQLRTINILIHTCSGKINGGKNIKIEPYMGGGSITIVPRVHPIRD